MGWRRRLRRCLTSISPGGSGNRPGGTTAPARGARCMGTARMPSQEARPGAEASPTAMPRAAGGAPGGAHLRSQGDAARLASVPGGCQPLTGPRKPRRFPALPSPRLAAGRANRLLPPAACRAGPMGYCRGRPAGTGPRPGLRFIAKSFNSDCSIKRSIVSFGSSSD
jgi:hypothetical protein